MKIYRIIDRVILIYFIYYLLVGLLATQVINRYVGIIYKDQTGRTLQYDSAGINPFTFALYIYQPKDINPDESVFWAADEVSLNPSLLGSVFSKGFVLDEVRIQSLYLHVKKQKNGEWVFADVLNHLDSQPTTPDATKDSAALPGIVITKVNFNARFLGYSDWARQEPFDASLNDININLSDFSTLAEEGRPYHFVASDEEGGELEWEGTLSLLSAKSSGRLDLRRISLLPAYRYIKSDVNFQLNSALAEVGANYSLSWADPANIQFVIDKGKFSLKKINMTPNDDPTSGFSLENFTIDNISVDSQKRSIYSPGAILDGFNGTVSILKDGSSNFTKMFSINNKNEPEEKGNTDARPWSFNLDTIKVINNEFYFNDNSISPNFSVFIKSFGGSIDGISTDKNAQTVFSMSGKVDEYAPVSLKGKINPAKDPLTAQAIFDFKGIDLTTFSPYSGTFAGKKIKKGLLSVNLSYQLDRGLIKGNNRVIIDQLTLGERVSSPRIIDLPLQLAIALLTDKDGVIDLNVDVSGNADNPDFSVGKVILTAFKNLIVKAVTSPFRFLASLLGSDDDFEFIRFNRGSSELSPESKAQLDKLATLFPKRPLIKIGLAGSYGENDIRYFKALSLRKAEYMVDLKQDDIDQANQKFGKALTKQYKRSFPDQEVPSISQMYDELINAEPLPELNLQEISSARALSVKQYLINEKQADPTRVFFVLEGTKERVEAVKLIADASEPIDKQEELENER